MPAFEPPTGPPLATYPLLLALMVTELFRLWSPLIAELLCAMAGATTTGTAGLTAGLPFTGEIEADFPCCCTGAEPPTATAGEGVEVPVAMGGDETAFFAVEAYDGVDCDALELLEAWLGIEDC